MEANGIRNGLLVTSDPYSKVLDPADRNTTLLFGDAAVATLLSGDAPQWSIGKFIFGTDGSHAGDLVVNEDRRLFMNGRAIFNFSATRVPQALRDTLEANELTLDGIDKVLLHQGSRYIVDTIGQRLGAKEKTPFLAGSVGNTVSSSIP